MLTEVFKIISFYDKVRWSSISNYNLINLFKTNLDDDTKLLTHWLCYITDRQMAFGRIWEVGGFVFSELVNNWKENKNIEILNPNKVNSFIKKKEGGGYAFTNISKVNSNSILLESYGYEKEEIAEFTSRYYPSDYFSILFTFDILKEYNYSLTKFIAEQLKKHYEKDDLIQRVLFSLYLLTYFEIRQPKKKDIDNFEINIEKAGKRTEKVLTILNENKTFEEEFGKFKKATIFNQKRAWCSLRDFFKSPEFNKYFKNSLEKEEIDTAQLFTLKSFQQFELPGDVWNNNSKFRNCILENTEYQNSKRSLNKILREYFEKNKEELGDSYPEQFDITFDFVPRMCENNNCDICPIGLIKGNKNSNFEKTCVVDTKYYCPVALTNCNYKIECLGKECELLKNTMPNSRV